VTPQRVRSLPRASSLDGTFREKDFEISRAGVRFGVQGGAGMARSASGGDLAILGDSDLWLPAASQAAPARAGEARLSTGCVRRARAPRWRRRGGSQTPQAQRWPARRTAPGAAGLSLLRRAARSNGHSRHSSFGGDGCEPPLSPAPVRWRKLLAGAALRRPVSVPSLDPAAGLASTPRSGAH
jgi:hypothetical protein